MTQEPASRRAESWPTACVGPGAGRCCDCWSVRFGICAVSLTASCAQRDRKLDAGPYPASPSPGAAFVFSEFKYVQSASGARPGATCTYTKAQGSGGVDAGPGAPWRLAPGVQHWGSELRASRASPAPSPAARSSPSTGRWGPSELRPRPFRTRTPCFRPEKPTFFL